MKRKRGLTPTDKFNFGGGLVTMMAKTRLAPNQLVAAKNVNIYVDGEIEVRGGCAKVSTVAFGTEIDRFIHFKTDVYDKIVAYGGTYIKRLDKGTPDVWTQLDGSMPDTEELRSLDIGQNKLYIGATDSIGVRKYVRNQSALWKAGITKPAAAITAADGGAGVLSGTYYWYWTYYNSLTGEESDPSPISGVLVVTDKQVTLSSFVASTDPQIDKIRIYRNPTGVSTWYYVGQKTNDVNNFTDNVADNNLGPEISFKNGEPPKAAILRYHLNRMFYVNADYPSRLYWSEALLPGSVHINSWQGIEDRDGGKILALGSSYDNIIVYKNTGVFCFSFDVGNPDNSSYIPLTSEYGIVAPMSVAHVGEDEIFLSSEGLKLITNGGTKIDEIEIPIIVPEGMKNINPITSIFRECKQDAISKAVGIYYEAKNQYHISVPYYSNSNNDLTLVWHKDVNAFTIHEDFNVKATGLYREYDNRLLYRSHNDQYIYQHDIGFTDDNVDITFKLQTGWNTLDGINDRKNIRLMFPTVYGADGVVLNYKIFKDFEIDGPVVSLTHQGASYWGYAHWGQNYWGAAGEVTYRKPTCVKGRIFSTQFYGTVNKKVGLADYQFFYQPKSL